MTRTRNRMALRCGYVLFLIVLVFAGERIRAKLGVQPLHPAPLLRDMPKFRPAVFRRELALLRAFNLGLVPAPDVAINEVCARGLPSFRDAQGRPHGWVELFNNTDGAVNLAGYSLTDARRRPRRWVFPEATLPPRGHLIVWLSGLGRAEGGDVHANFRLSPRGEFLALYNPAGGVEDYLVVEEVPEGATYRRPRDGDGPFAAGAPTPMGRPLAPAVSADMPSGVYDGPLEVRLHGEDAAAEVRYTLDGFEPGPESPLYTGPIRVKETAVLKACAFREGAWPGPVTPRFYWLGAEPPLPVLSLAADPADLYADGRGIIAECDRGGPEWERPAWVTFLEGGRTTFEGPGGIRVHGQTTRRLPKKSFKLYFRPRYGLAECPYDLLDPASGRTLKRIVVKGAGDRSSHDEWRRGLGDTSLLASPLGYEMMRACGVPAPRTRYVLVMLNAHAHGIGYLAEDIDERFMEQHYGHADFDLIKIASRRPAVLGRLSRFEEMNEWAAGVLSEYKDDPDEVRLQLAERLDLDSLTRWVIVTVFTGVRDHVQGLFAFDRRAPGARWEMIAWDMDSAFRRGSRYPADLETWQFDKLKEFSRYGMDPRGRMIRRLIEGEGYRAAYGRLLQDLVNHRLRPEQWLPWLDQHVALLARALPYEERGDANRGIRYPRDLRHRARLKMIEESIRDFLVHRPAHLLAQTGESLGLGAPCRVAFRVEGEGELLINGFRESDGFAGSYYPGSVLALGAVPAPGYRLSHWACDGGEVQGREMEYPVHNDAEVKAVFTMADEKDVGRER